MEYLNVWLTKEEIEAIKNNRQVHINHNSECSKCGETTEVIIQIQIK